MTCLTGIRSVCLVFAAWGMTSLSAQQIYLLQSIPSNSGQAAISLNALGDISMAQRVAVPEAGSRVMVLTADGKVWEWDGLQPVERWRPIEGLDDATAIAAGAMHGAALRPDGTVWTWGANDQGQLGNGEWTPRVQPGLANGLSDVTAIAAGKAFTLALRADGTVWMFGANWNQIVPGDPRKMIADPVAVAGLTGIDSIAVFRNRAYARDRAGRILEWGSDGVNSGPIAPHEMAAGGIDGFELLREVSRRLDHGRLSEAALTGKWFDNSGLARDVRLAGSRIHLDERMGLEPFSISGAVVDADLGWAVAVIANHPSSAASDSFNAGVIDSQKAEAPLARGAVFAAVDPRFSSSSPSLGSAQFHNLYLQQGGSVCAWGGNGNGQLGDGTAVDRLAPVTAAGLSGMSMVSAGWFHGIGLKSDGTVWTWGENANGQLGDNGTHAKPTPNQVPGLTGVSAVAAGGYHSLALKSDGTVWAWGLNSSGQLGDGSNTQRNAPVQVAGLTNVSAIAAGERFSLALRSDGSVVAWGLNASGQLGDGSNTNRPNFVVVAGLSNAVSIAAGSDHGLVRKLDGTVWAWGFNGFGQLGDGSTTNRSAPVQAVSLGSVVAIGAGSYHSLAVQSTGAAWTWGLGTSGQMGDGSTNSRSTPGVVGGLTGVSGVAGGAGHSLAVKSDGSLFAWGGNGNGALGNGGLGGTATPAAVNACASGIFPPVTLESRGRRITASRDHGMVVRTDGAVLAWGRNQAGQLGDGSTTDRSTPGLVLGVAGAQQASAGWTHGLAVKTDGTVRSWGSNSSGQLGIGNNLQQLTSVQVTALADVMWVAAGGFHSLAVKSDGTAWAWGLNSEGQLGDSTNITRNSPVQVSGLTGITMVAAGERFSLALKNDGTVWAWGLNNIGQLGDHTFANRNAPVQVIGLANIIAIAAGTDHSLALRSDGTVWAWGYNGNGQLGDGSTSNRADRVRVSGLTQVVGIAAADNHSLATRSDGSAWAWGLNSSGQLGDNSTVSKRVPTQVMNLAGTVAVAGGLAHSLALGSSEGVWGWGANNVGQFGAASPASSLIPVQAQQLPFCTYFINPTGVISPDVGSSGTASVSTAFACSWTASSSVPWISVSSSQFSGPGSFTYSVAPNPTASSRTGTVVVGNKTLTVIQSAGTGCAYSINPTILNTDFLGGSGQVNVTTSPGCAWSVASNDFWITITSGTGGSGSGSATFIYDANNSVVQRAGTISVAGQLFTIFQDPPGGGGSAFTPQVGAPSPASGSGFAQTFSFTFSDANGATDLSVVNVLINNAIDGRNGCYIAFAPSGVNTGTLFLVNNNGDAGGPFAGTISIPGSGVAANGQCTVSAAGSSATIIGDTLTLNLNISFTSFFAGNRIVYVAARDAAANNSGWHAKAVWTVPGALFNPASVTNLNPTRSTATSLTLTTSFSDTAGFAALDILNILINNAIDGRQACYLAYVRATNTLVLVNDAGDAGGPFAGQIVIPGGGSVSNSQCTINALGSSALGSGNTLTLVLNMSFHGAFGGDRVIYAAARDTFGNNSGWQAMGTITVQ
ncbi:MAG: BACON domain-containing carbohydrate-binding protein [Bryobacteraceae bacterium]